METFAELERETLRREIDTLLARADFERIGAVRKYSIVERAVGWPDCITYALPEFDWRNELIEIFLEREYTEVAHGETGDVVLYFESKDSQFPSHVGILQERGIVRSKFGFGYVYDHPVDLVPTMYGTGRFFRKRH